VPIVTTTTVERNLAHHRARTAGQRAMARIAGPTAAGVTLYRIDGTWRQEQTPAHHELAQADVVLQGGHVYHLSQSDYEDLTGAGFTVNVVATATLPSSSTFPSKHLYPYGG
jgi:hypothetical protein